MSVVVSLLLPALLVTGVVLGVRAVVRRGGPGAPATDAHTVRRVFQYLLLYGLLVITAVGASGLLGRLLRTEPVVVGDDAALARELAFTLVGAPLLVAAALWTRRRFADRSGEQASLSWAAYLTLAALTALVTAMTALHRVLGWALGVEDGDGAALARAVVWGTVWAAHFWLGARATPADRGRPHLLLGSLVGLAVAATGLGTLLSGTLRTLVGPADGDVLAGQGSPLLSGVVTLLVGAPVWLLYWARSASRSPRTVPWLVYVLLAGVAAGLLTAVVAASTLAYSLLVWLVGDPGAATAAEHFANAPGAAAAALVGALVWWYHQAVLRSAGAGPRTEVHRVSQYLMAAVGLLAAAGAAVTLLAAGMEAVAGTALVGGGAVNTLLAAATLLAVGGPVWWVHWRRAQRAASRLPGEELASPTRRLYLLVLFGVGLLAAVVSLVTGVYLLLEDVVVGRLGAETLRGTRFAVGVLLTSGAVAAYHWSVYRSDRDRLPAATAVRGPRLVLLVGPRDERVAGEVERLTSARVQAWWRTDTGAGEWPAEQVAAALAGTDAPEVLLLHEAGVVRAVPVRRG